MYLQEIVINFTTTEVNQDIYTDFIAPRLRSQFGYSTAATTAGIYLDIRILFDSDFSGDITINGVASKAEADVTLGFVGDLTSCVISANSTVGQVKMRF